MRRLVPTTRPRRRVRHRARRPIRGRSGLWIALRCIVVRSAWRESRPSHRCRFVVQKAANRFSAEVAADGQIRANRHIPTRKGGAAGRPRSPRRGPGWCRHVAAHCGAFVCPTEAPQTSGQQPCPPARPRTVVHRRQIESGRRRARLPNAGPVKAFPWEQDPEYRRPHRRVRPKPVRAPRGRSASTPARPPGGRAICRRAAGPAATPTRSGEPARTRLACAGRTHNSLARRER